MIEPPKSDVSHEISLSRTFQANANENYRRSEDMRILGFTEESGKDVYLKLVDVEQKPVLLTPTKVSACVTVYPLKNLHRTRRMQSLWAPQTSFTQ